MSERDARQIRKEIADERRDLGEDVDQLRTEVRSIVPLLVGGLALVGALTLRKGAARAARLVGRLR